MCLHKNSNLCHVDLCYILYTSISLVKFTQKLSDQLTVNSEQTTTAGNIRTWYNSRQQLAGSSSKSTFRQLLR